MTETRAVPIASITTVLVMLSTGAAAAPPLPGAIFTTDESGNIVNGNTQYQLQCDVYLDGGPGPNAPQKAAGLPDGDYYYQVTDPSGKKLLSEDPAINRCVTVADGIMVSQCQDGNHGEGASSDHGGITIQLCPFDRTPNPGGVYKAWVTPTEDYQVDPADNTPSNYNCGNGCFNGFLPAASKTDNFKVGEVETFCIDVYKEIVDAKKGTVPGAGWGIFFGGNTLFTDAEGFLEICGLVAGTYPISESLVDSSGAPYMVVHSLVNGVEVEPPSENLTISIGKNNDPDPGIVLWVNQPTPKK